MTNVIQNSKTLSVPAMIHHVGEGDCKPDHVADYEVIGLMSHKVVHGGRKAVLQEANGSLCGFSSQ